jgi:hypothetical protein
MADGTFTGPSGVDGNVDGQTWNPSVVTDDGDAAKNSWTNGDGDGWKTVFAPKDGGDDSTPDDPEAGKHQFTPPTLTLKDSDWPLHATGEMGGGGGGGTPPTTAPDVPDFSVTVGTLRDAQSAVLPSANTATDKYNSLKDSTGRKAAWIFQQDTSGDLGTYYFWNPASQGTQVQDNQADPKLIKQTPIMTEALEKALLSVADAVHLAGEYAGFLNTAAQSYTYADKESYLKAPDL